MWVILKNGLPVFTKTRIPIFPVTFFTNYPFYRFTHNQFIHLLTSSLQHVSGLVKGTLCGICSHKNTVMWYHNYLPCYNNLLISFRSSSWLSTAEFSLTAICQTPNKLHMMLYFHTVMIFKVIVFLKLSYFLAESAFSPEVQYFGGL